MSLMKSQENRGKPCEYNDKKYFIVYEAENFVLISKKKNLKKAFKVNPTDIKKNG
jgi:hypothetical protein